MPEIVIDKESGKKEIRLNNSDILLDHYISKEGLTVTEAARKAGLSRHHASNQYNKLKRYRITSPELLKKGKQAVHQILNDFIGKAVQKDGETPEIRPSEVLKIVEMQQDRIYPVVKTLENTGQSISFTQININPDYLNRPSRDVKEITYEMVQGKKDNKMVVVDNGEDK